MTPAAATRELPYEPPLDWGAFLRYLAARATPGVERVVGERYLRAAEVEGARGLLEVRHDPARSCLIVRVSGELAARPRAVGAVAARVSGLFDLAADLAEVHEVLLADPALAPAVRAAPGLRVTGAWSPFELLVRAIVGQQVSVKAASTLMGRLAARFGAPLPEPGPGVACLFPTPAALAAADLTGLGMPGRRAAALQGVARAVADGLLPLAEGGELGEVRAALLALRGIGPWTADYFALRALGDRDAWPAGDLVLRRAVEALLGGDERPVPSALLARAARWRPWRAYAAVHLWHAAAPPVEARR